MNRGRGVEEKRSGLTFTLISRLNTGKMPVSKRCQWGKVCFE